MYRAVRLPSEYRARVRAFAIAAFTAVVVVEPAGSTTTASGGWEPGPQLPSARSELTVVALDRQVYALGGIARFGTTDAVERLDIATGEWRALAPLPKPLNHLAAAAIQGRVCISGGYSNVQLRSPLSQAWCISPGAPAWRALPDLPSARAAHASVAVGNRLFVLGGVGPEPSALWAFNPEAGRWESHRAPLPTPREHLAAVVVAERIYVLGGRTGGRNLGLVEIYDVGTDEWTRGPAMQVPRSGFAAGVLDGVIHVVGGETLSAPTATLASHEVFDVSAGGWRTAAALPRARHGLGSAVSQGSWYVVGGATRAGFATFFSMSGTVDQWRVR